MEITSYSNFRQNLKSFLDKVFTTHAPLFVTRTNGEDVVVLSKSDYESMQETFYLLKSPKNAERLAKGLEEFENNKGQERELFEKISMKIIFLNPGWEDYIHWQNSDKKIVKKINALIKEIQRTPFEGTGKPEPLKHQLSGWWSRRIDLEHRLVYKVEAETIHILQCRYHY